MVMFSGISGSKMADVAAVGSVLIPAARRSGQKPGSAVALLAASAVMAETIPPCINLIILGFVANLSIGGLFMAGLLPAGADGAGADRVSILFGKRPPRPRASAPRPRTTDRRRPVGRRGLTLGLIAMIFGGFKLRLCDRDRNLRLRRALCAGGRRRGVPRTEPCARGMRSFVHAATRSGLVLFIVAAAQSLAFVLTLQQVPHAWPNCMIALSGVHGAPGCSCCCRSRILIVMGSVLEGAAALIIFGPLLMPVAAQARHRSAALRRGAGDRHGHRPVRPAARPRPIRRLPDRRRADRGRRCKPMLGYLGLLLALPAGDRLRAST
jgi:TRAP-type C4-dicarboxylate transport system permease large subunit